MPGCFTRKGLAETGVLVLKISATGRGIGDAYRPQERYEVRVDHEARRPKEAGATRMGNRRPFQLTWPTSSTRHFREAAEGMFGSNFQTSVNHNRGGCPRNRPPNSTGDCCAYRGIFPA